MLGDILFKDNPPLKTKFSLKRCLNLGISKVNAIENFTGENLMKVSPSKVLFIA